MNLSIYNPSLVRGIVAGALVLSGLSACSRPDRADAGRDTTQSGALAAPTDTGMNAEAQPSAGAVAQPSDSARMSAPDTSSTGAQIEAPRQKNTARSNPDADTNVAAGEDVSGYRAMAGDTAETTPVDTASAEMAGAATADSATAEVDQPMTQDTSASSSPEMARDTTTAAGIGDTAAVAVADSGIAAESDTAGNIQIQADTATTEQAQVDTSAGVLTDTASVATGDTTPDNAGRIRPPEDSTEILGNVTTDSGAVANNDDASQPDSTRIRPPADSTEISGNMTTDEDRAAVGSPEAENGAVGAAATGGTVTGADAVALMSRAGERCIMLDEGSTEAAWDISDSPANLNPCGPGTMTLSPVRTGERH